MQENGIHHITAIAGNAQRNLAFYTRTLGLRLVKKTVNFDDPTTYHFYFGDAAGAPGTLITFFPWDGIAAGRLGIGEVAEVLLRVPEDSFGFWTHRFVEKGVAHDKPETRVRREPPGVPRPGRNAPRFGRAAAGQSRPGVERRPGRGRARYSRAARRQPAVDESDPTAAVLGILGYSETGREETRVRLESGSTSVGAVMEIRAAGGFLPARMGAGSIHHIAFRANDDAMQAEMAEKLAARYRIRPTEQKDRQYFRSVYFREPGGVLFEIATDGPGFEIDEAPDNLGQALKLPPFLEANRRDIEAQLPEVA